ncbi:MAG: nuclear transport factor 2 family protein [Prochlorococcus sp.]
MPLTRDYVKTAFLLLERGLIDCFINDYISVDVKWTITGSSVLAGTYINRLDFIQRAISRLQKSLKGTIKWQVQSIFIDGNAAIVEMRSDAVAAKGHVYNNQYAWIMKFKQGMIIEARVYYDDVLVDQTII